MSRRTFTPPRYEETVHLLFDKHTGDVVASERRWTLTDGAPRAEATGRSRLFEGVCASLGKKPDDLDVLVLRGPDAPDAQIARIDVRHQKPIVEDRVSTTASTGGHPRRIDAP